jgi:hypothetical protein
MSGIRGWRSRWRAFLRPRSIVLACGSCAFALPFSFVSPEANGADFRRGDANTDGVVDLADSSYLARWFFAGGVAPPCKDAADANGDQIPDITDLVILFYFLFKGGAPPPAPGPLSPGPPRAEDTLDCASYDPAPPPSLANFGLGFDGTAAVFGTGDVSFDVFATLTTADDALPEGPEGWAISLTAEGATIQGITVDGVHVSTTRGDEDLKDSGLVIAELASQSDGSGRQGAVSAILLPYLKKNGLLPMGTQPIARITLKATVPSSGDPLPITLRYEDGFQGGGLPVKSMVSFRGTSQVPTLGSFTTFLKPGIDCNKNGIDDSLDLSSGTSQDCNGNGIPDECEPGCNGKMPDACAIASGASKDCNGNGIPDECDVASGKSNDCNMNGVPDECDLASGTSKDCNGMGIPDECKPDCQPNGIADACEIAQGLTADSNGDRIPDECAGGPQFSLGFEGCPPVITGAPGEVKTFDVYATLTTAFNPTRYGVQNWTYSLTVTGARVDSVTLDGIVFSTNLGDLDSSKVAVSYLCMGHLSSDPTTGMVISSVALADQIARQLKATGTQKLLKIVIEAKVPEGEIGQPITLKFVEGGESFVGSCQGQSTTRTAPPPFVSANRPDLGECTFLVRKRISAVQRPGDANQDGGLDLSDAIWLLGHLFLGTQPKLPCEGGTASNPGPGDLALVDVNGDGTIDLSDGVSILSFLFLGSKPPVLGTSCVPILGCPDNSARCP